MRILVIGSGGREHALVKALGRSPQCDAVIAMPGNGGIAEDAECVSISVDDHGAVSEYCKNQAIDLVVIGPEAPLVDGLADHLKAESIRVFGPSAAAAELEGSKQFMKDVVAELGIPTAAYGNFDNADDAKAYIQQHGAPIVIKTDGLAAGKGVVIAQSVEEALAEVDEYFSGKFGAAGQRVVIEEFLEGEEASIFAICDGKTALFCGTAQDHKAVGEGDTGPNTGGMGTYSPAPVVDAAMQEAVMASIMQRLVDGMAARGTPYTGFLFAGLMIDKNGQPKLLEYNVRFGDPEAQVVLPRVQSDLAELLVAASDGELAGKSVSFSDDAALCVVMAAEGYPGSYEKGSEIKNLDAAGALDDVTILHAGTKNDGGCVLANGGRVLGVSALGGTVSEAQRKAYAAVDAIDWPQGFCRRDIGWRAVEREQGSKVA